MCHPFLINLVRSSIFMHDTNRVVHVTLRFFIFREPFDTLKLAGGHWFTDILGSINIPAINNKGCGIF